MHQRILQFLESVFKHWGALLTGGVLIAILSIYQGTGHSVSPWLYGVGALVAFLPAAFLAWNKQRDRAETSENQLRRSEREAPELFVSWNHTGQLQYRENPELRGMARQRCLVIENRGSTDAFNISIEPICLSSSQVTTANFSIIPCIRAGASSPVLPRMVGNVSEQN